ncbi:MAG: hypothetical protein R3F62_13990 [Planctomycetota bacterium]
MDREGAASRRGPRKRRFSIVLCRTRFDGQRLEIDGRLRLAAFLLLVMAGVCVWIVGVADVPLPVRLGAGLGALIAAYGFVDTCFGTCHLRYDTQTQALELARGNPFGKVEFAGKAAGNVSVSRVSAGRSRAGNVQLYTVVFHVNLPDALVNFPLEAASYPEAASQERMQHWARELGLAQAA